jgi:hypothetical protein
LFYASRPGASRLCFFHQPVGPFKGIVESLLPAQHRLKQVSLPVQTPKHVLDREVAGCDLPCPDLFPLKRSRHGRPLTRSHRIGRDDRLPARVLQMVEIDEISDPGDVSLLGANSDGCAARGAPGRGTWAW